MTFTTTRTEAADAKDTTEKLDSIGPFCGTYCVYAAAKRLGKEVDVLQLTTPELVYSHKGSTLVDLQAAADKVGLHSKIVSNWSAADLKHCNCAILRVKGTPFRLSYDHYVLFLGSTKAGGAVLYDPPLPPQNVPYSDIMSRWDGTAILLSNQPVDSDSSVQRAHLLRSVTICTLLFLGAISLKRAVNCRNVLSRLYKQSWLRRFGFQVASVVTLSIIPAVMFNVMSDCGLLRTTRSIDSTEKAYLARSLPGILPDEKALASCVVIDSRLPDDYKKGHIENAINVPAVADVATLRKALRDISTHRRIVVYCESNSCNFDKELARRLLELGFQDVSLLSGGWSAWEKSHRH